MNTLYYGDCLEIMQEMPVKGVDLIYLDPPFNSDKQYNSIYKDETGRPLPEQIEAFCDQWTLDEERERAIRNMPILMREAGIEDEIADFWRLWVNALRATQPRLLAYLSYMVQRLLVMRTLLSDTGSIYLHCDPTVSHYIKIMMDGIFGHKNFRNEIAWCYDRWDASSNHFQRMHDIILFYSKTETFVFNRLTEIDSKRQKTLDRGYTTNLLGDGTRQLIIYEGSENKPNILKLKEKDKFDRVIIRPKERLGRPLKDYWNINFIHPRAKERLGYATQKPLALLERIIQASSNEGDVVLDPFCGCATTLEAAHSLGRKWIGVDIAIHAIKRVAKRRLEERLHLVEGQDFEVKGIPQTLEGAKDLWKRDKYQFQKWCIEQVDGFVTARKTADGGIDGRLYFDTREKELQSMVLEVKGGKNVGIADLRALHSVMNRDGAEMAGLIIMEPLGERKERNFHKLMAEAGDLEVFGKQFPRMQMLTVGEIIEGKRFETPFPQGKRDRQMNLLP